MKTWLKEWFDAIIFAVVVATLVRWLTLEAFVIPTPSMEKSMLVGDYLFVSKLHYGTRIPKTPLQVPLTHQFIWGTKIPSYVDWIELPYYRLPGFSKVKRNEPVVFNLPHEHQYPDDLKTFYVKRCVAIPGDTITIEDQQILINSVPQETKGVHQSSYLIVTNTQVNDRIFKQYDISDYYKVNKGYVVHMPRETADRIESLDFVDGVEPINYNQRMVQSNVFPNDGRIFWTIDNFGPLYMPKAGDQIELTPKNISLYRDVIMHYEDNENVKIEENSVSINGAQIDTYTFKQGYYWMMGDNRHNSLDARYWGFVPEDHIVGKPLFVFFSVEDGPWYTLPMRIRWSRLFKLFE
ncbi:MAG: signal peptidase I [Bacteroidota bacterium]